MRSRDRMTLWNPPYIVPSLSLSLSEWNLAIVLQRNCDWGVY